MPDKINILYIIGSFRTGGAEKHLTCVLTHLDKRKFQPFVACLEKSGDYLPEVEKLNIPVIDLALKRVYGFSGMKKIFFLKKFIRENQIDIIHSYIYGANFLGSLTGKFAGIPTITSNRNVNSALKGRQQFMDKIAATFATMTTAVSEEVRRLDVERGIPAKKIITIHNGVDISSVPVIKNQAAKKVELGLSPNCTIIGTVANLQPRKGHVYLLQAARQVISVIPNVQFLLVGYGPLKQELEKQIAELDLSGKVILAGQRKDVPELLRLMNLFVLPSLAEGMSNALLEAMAAGLPCVVTNVGGNPEVVQNNVTGFVVPPQSPDNLAQAILKLLQDKELAARMGKCGQNRIMSDFTVGKMVSKLEELYTSVLEKQEAKLLSSKTGSITAC